MNAFIRFAKAMSKELFEMRSVDIQSTSLYIEDQHGNEVIIDNEYKDKVLYSDIHAAQIKLLIEFAVLAAVQHSPDDYDMNGTEYVYSGPIYDQAYLVDAYIQDEYVRDHPEFHTRHICTACGSDNVQVKAWVRPNQNHKFVDEVNAPDEPGFCDDCQQHVDVDTQERNVRTEVIGFQVVSVHDIQRMHPAMTNEKCVYTIMQADAMLRDLKAEGRWELLAIWTGDIQEVVMMFDGDPRNGHS